MDYGIDNSMKVRYGLLKHALPDEVAIPKS